MKMRLNTTATLTMMLSLAWLGGCATGPIGAVLPLEGGQFQHSVTGGDPQDALKSFTHDAALTCGGGSGKPRMPWEAAPAANYVVVSQSIKDKDGKEIKAANKNVEAGIAVGLRYLGLDAKDTVQTTTVFRCK